MKLYAQMMQQATGKASRTSTSSADPLVASSPSGTNPTPSTGIKSSPGMNHGGKKSTQRMSQMLKNKLMMTTPLAFNMFNRGAVPEEPEEEEQAGPLQSGTLELTLYTRGDGGYGYSQPDAQQQIMAESLRAKYGIEADPSLNPSWKSQGQQGGWNPKGLLALPAPEGSLATEESDIALHFGAPFRAEIVQFGSPGFAQIQGAGYQQQRQMQLQQSQDGVGVQQGAQFGSAGYAMSQNAMYQQRLQQLKQQQQQQEAPGPELGMQYGSPTRAQDQQALYQPKLQQQQTLQQQMLQQQQQQQQQQQLQLQSFSQAGQRLGDQAVLYSQGMESNASGSGFPQQQQQLIQQGQFGSTVYAQSQSAMYQQKLMQQRQKQQQLKQQQQQQQQQQLLLQGPGQEAGMEAVQQPGYAPNPMYQQQDLQQQQFQQQQQQQQLPASASGQLGSAQYAQGQAAVYQQRLQQLKQRQQQQQQQSREPTPSPSQAYQSQQQGQQMQMQPGNTYQASPNGDGQMLPVAASVAVQAAASSAGPGNQMGSVGFALAQNAKYQQQLQQQQLRRQQRQQLEQQQLQQQPTAQMQLVQARQQQQPSQQSALARLPPSNEVRC
jgi:hypothetical protein